MTEPEPFEDISRWVPPSAEELSQQVTGYEVTRLLARGGMAAVYVARQRSLDRPVALKLLPPELGRLAGFNEQFANEARVLARLQHPAVVTVIDFGHTRQGSGYIVMELVEGLPLTRWAAGRSFAEKVKIACQLLEGVAYFHQQGVVHADLKPDNIYVTAKGEIKILDFGLATAFREAGELTAPRFGTPPYTAPEAYDPEARPDPRSDIYSVGQILAELFGASLVAPPGTGPLPPLTQRLGRRDLAALLEPMLSEHPAARPADLSQVAARLQALAHRAASLPPQASTPRANRPVKVSRKKPTSPKPWLWAAAGLAAAGLIGWLSHSTRSKPDTRPASSGPEIALVDPVPAPPAPPPAELPPPELASSAPPPPPAEPTKASSMPSVASLLTPIPPPPPVTEEVIPSKPPAPLRELQEKYLAALQRGQNQAVGKVAEAWAKEAARFSKERHIPEQDEPDLLPEIARFRDIYRSEARRLKARGDGESTSEVTTVEPELFSFPAVTSPSPASAATAPAATAAAAPSVPKATLTLWWQCNETAEPLLNGNPIPARVVKTGPNSMREIWEAEVSFHTGDVLGFKLSNTNGQRRHFVAVARAGTLLLFVSDSKWQVLDEEPPEGWWTGQAQGGSSPQRVPSREYNGQEVRDFCSFTRVPQGSLTICWGRNAEQAYFRRVLTKFDYQTALGVRAR